MTRPDPVYISTSGPYLSDNPRAEFDWLVRPGDTWVWVGPSEACIFTVGPLIEMDGSLYVPLTDIRRQYGPQNRASLPTTLASPHPSLTDASIIPLDRFLHMEHEGTLRFHGEAS